MYECALCGSDIGHKSPKSFWCNRCYSDWRQSILDKEPWTVYLVNLEANRRYGEKTMSDLGIQLVYLSNKFEVTMVNGKAELVPTKEYYDEVD